MRPTVEVLKKHLGTDVIFVDEAVGAKAEEAVANAPQGAVIILENTRFYPGEEKNDLDLAQQLAKLGDVYVNDAFGSAHRAHSSTEGVARYLPAVSGLLMEKEIDYLATALENPKRPFIAILGGAKVSDKIEVIESLLGKVDHLLIGGGMANTFFKAQGLSLGKSLVEADAVETAAKLLKESGGKLVLPIDAVIGDSFDNNAKTKTINVADGVPDGWSIYDIGPKTIELF